MDGVTVTMTRPARLVVVENVYHQPTNGPAVTVAGTRFGRNLAHGEDRRPDSFLVVVGAEWTALDCGRVPACGQIVLVNEEGRFTGLQPTQAERTDAAYRVVEVAVEGGPPLLLVRPGESARFEPADATRLRLRSRHATARVTVHLVPA